MIFPSYIFLLVFLPSILLLWHSIRDYRSRLLVLNVSSYIFYASWDYRFCSLLLLSTLVDFYAGGRVYSSNKTKSRKFWLSISIGTNLGVLGFFKYFDFFSSSFNLLLNNIGFTASLPILDIILPLGISFYTFQSMSYTLDIFRGKCKPAPDLLSFSAYISMFPQLIAGPIVRYSEIESQLRRLSKFKISSREINLGIWLLTIGLCKKVMIADSLAPYAISIFDEQQNLLFGEAWIGALAYTFQLYFDFSGYSDMARGLGFLLGFTLPVNFNSPYKSTNISEFWNRWHITLSHWLRDYLYFPLGGSRDGVYKTLRNLLIVMFLGGLWHGAGWTYVLWGLFHGLLLVLYNLWKNLALFKLPIFAARLLTFTSVVFGWVLFRSDSISRASEITVAMLGKNGFEVDLLSLVQEPMVIWNFSQEPRILILTLALALTVFPFNSETLPKPDRPIWGIVPAIAFIAVLMSITVETPFLYFQF